MISRRQFLRGDLSGRKAPLRPPWALVEDAFLAACTRCGECIKVCPENILVEVRGYPTVQFTRGECTFCGKCHAVCKARALQPIHGLPPWELKAQADTTGCMAYRNVVCRSCGDACAAAAIRFTPRVMAAAIPEVNVDRCTGCGACVEICPAGAITMR